MSDSFSISEFSPLDTLLSLKSYIAAFAASLNNSSPGSKNLKSFFVISVYIGVFLTGSLIDVNKTVSSSNWPLKTTKYELTSSFLNASPMKPLAGDSIIAS